MHPRTGALIVLVVLLAVAAVAAATGAAELFWHGRLFAARATFPLDLEWMEGGMLVHAQRLAEGKALYVKPSLEFIPFLYTPFYYAVLAGLSKLLPLGYMLGRAVSLLAFAGSLALLVIAAWREAGRAWPARALALLVGLAGAGAVTAGFEFSGAFYDLARSDSLLLLLEAGALAVALWGRSLGSAAVAGALMALAFLTKQTGPVVGVGIGLGLLIANWRRGLVYGAVAGALMGLGLLYLIKSSDGWFWTYIYKLHQSHPFRPDTLPWSRAYIKSYEWPTLAALVLSAVGLALGRRLRRSDAILAGAALAGIVAGILGFATMWAWYNAFIPTVYFPAFAAAVLSARLLVSAAENRKVVAIAFGCVAVAALAAQNVKVGRPTVALRAPLPPDRAAAGRFLERLRGLRGEGYVPFHPFYAVLVGGRPYVHRMGVMDVGPALGRPAGLDQAILQHRFAWIVLDGKSQPGEWPNLDARYRVIHEFREGFDSTRMFAGADTSPRWLMVPVHDPPALPPGGSRVFDFELASWRNWTVEGGAFGYAPAPSPEELFGRSVADSVRYGPAAQGSVRSPPFRIDRPHLRFVMTGPADPALRVVLLVGGIPARSAVSRGGVATVEWDVAKLVGREAVLLIEDRSLTAGFAVDDVVEY